MYDSTKKNNLIFDHISMQILSWLSICNINKGNTKVLMLKSNKLVKDFIIFKSTLKKRGGSLYLCFVFVTHELMILIQVILLISFIELGTFLQ